MSIKITHLFHSGFIAETKKHTLVFDYFNYEGNINFNLDGILSSNYFADKENVFVFVTHGHGDHFSDSIFNWENFNSNIKYILSDDIHINNPKSNYYFIKPDENLKVEGMKIKTFGSTDRGVSFLVYVDDFSIFHSGDLNWWHWKNDSPNAHAKEAEDFKREVDKLRDYIDEEIDVAFVPVDPRLEEFYYLAGEYFAKTIKPNLLIPMHFSTSYSITEKFRDKISDLDVKTVVLSNPNEEILYTK